MNEEAALMTETALDLDRSLSGDGVAVEGAAERGGAANRCNSLGFKDDFHSLSKASRNVT